MKLKTPYKKLFSVYINELENLINQISDQEWDDWDIRQKKYDPHFHTRTYPLMFWSNLDTFDLLNENICHIHVFNRSSLLHKTALKVVEQVENFYGGKCINLIIVKLLPNSIIPSHRDCGYLLSNCHRFHLPIKTNENVLFSIRNQVLNFEKGFVYEISNLDVHSVKNNSNEERVHLIFDILEDDNKVLVDFVDKVDI